METSAAVNDDRTDARSGDPILEVRDLVVDFDTRHGKVHAVKGVSFQLRAGETLGIVGESGSGKSVTALSILGLLPRNARLVSGSIKIHGQEIVGLPEAQMRRLRGRTVSMVLQDPLTSLNPVFGVGWQVDEAVRLVSNLRGSAVTQRTVDLLASMRIPAPQDRVHSYPHEMSGGMRQRVVGAVALAGPPQILIADEPTTALDATIQAQYLQLLQEVQRRLGLAVIFITHDFGIVAELCDRVAVMYAGRIVETADVYRLFDHPSHPYTRGLLDSVPELGRTDRLYSIPAQPPASGEALPACAFAPRCPLADERCFEEAPPTVDLADGHWATCWRLV